MQQGVATFEELGQLQKEVVLKGIETINGEDAYAIVDGKKTNFYSVKTALKMATATEMEQRGQKMTQMVYLKNYKDINGVQYPQNMTMNMGIELELTAKETKINEGVTDADFE